MLQSFWQKKIICLIQMEVKDSNEDIIPPFLIIEFSWHHYVGLYYDKIRNFYAAWVTYPNNINQFWLQLLQQKQQLKSTDIVSHIVSLFNLDLNNYVHLKCYFRSKKQRPMIDMKQYYKNSIKNSACIRDRARGAKIITVQMSVQNIQSMYENFCNCKFNEYLGTSDFQEDNLGYKYMISQGDLIPLRLKSINFIIERVVKKQQRLQKCLNQILNLVTQEIQKKIRIILHSIQLKTLNITLQTLQRYCHPDGYLYLIIIFK